MLAYLAEHLILGLATAVAAGALGIAVSWAVVARIMEFPWEADFPTLLGTLLLAVSATTVMGGVSGWRALGRKAAGELRND